MLLVIFEIRKYKSEQNISMKTILDKFTINSQIDFTDILEDLKNVTNSNEIIITKGTSDFPI